MSPWACELLLSYPFFFFSVISVFSVMILFPLKQGNPHTTCFA